MVRGRDEGDEWYVRGVRVVNGTWEGEGDEWYVDGEWYVGDESGEWYVGEMKVMSGM